MFVENDGGRPTPTGGAHEGVPHLRKDGVFTQVGEAVFFFR